MRKAWCFVLACMAALTVTCSTAHARGHVYLLPGLVNVFSQGMDTMSDKLRRRGVNASVHGHGEHMALATEAAALARSGKGPIIIVGHSLGERCWARRLRCSCCSARRTT